MKLLFICLCSILISIQALSQDISMKALLKLRQLKDPSAVDRKLSKKGWTMWSDQKPAGGLTGVAVWAYKPNNGKAFAWIYYFYSSDADVRVNVIQYNPSCDCPMTTFDRAVRALKMIYWNSGEHVNGEDDRYSYKAFLNRQYGIRLLTYPGEEGKIGIQLFDGRYYLSTIDGKGYL